MSKLTFTWFDSTIFNGYRQTLTVYDIFPSSWSNQVEGLTKKFAIFLKLKKKIQFKLSNNGIGKFHIITILVRQFGLEYAQIAIIKLIPTLLTFLSPILLNRLIQFAKNG